MVVASHTIARLVCLDCMQGLLQGLFLAPPAPAHQTDLDGLPVPVESFPPLSVMDVLEEVGSVAFLQENPPCPEHAPHIDDDLDAWALYQLWEHSAALEVLQDDHKATLSASMKGQYDANANSKISKDKNKSGVEESKKPNTTGFTVMTSSARDAAPERYGCTCGSPFCDQIHGKKDALLQKVVLLSVVCQECDAACYCSKNMPEKSC